MSSARRAIGILAQLEFAELHVQGIEQQQPADQRSPLPKISLITSVA